MSEPIRRDELEKLFEMVTWGDQIRAERAAGAKATDGEKTAHMVYAAAKRAGIIAEAEPFEDFADRIVLADMVGLSIGGADADPEADADPQ